MVPPGYRILADGTLSSMLKCDAGTYREGWVGFSDLRASSCTPCGTGISSEPRDLDQNPLAGSGSLVMASPASCCEYDQGFRVEVRVLGVLLNPIDCSDCSISEPGYVRMEAKYAAVAFEVLLGLEHLQVPGRAAGQTS